MRRPADPIQAVSAADWHADIEFLPRRLTWVNPTRLMIFSYHEGDTTLKEARSPEEFAADLPEIEMWNRAHGGGPARIDPGFEPAMKGSFDGLGLDDLLH